MSSKAASTPGGLDLELLRAIQRVTMSARLQAIIRELLAAPAKG